MRGKMREGVSRPWRAWWIGGGSAVVAAVIALVLVLQSPPPTPSEQPAQPPLASQSGPAPGPLPAPQAPVSASQAPTGAAPLSLDRERALKPKDIFSECANCPEMVVVPAGSFTMGSPSGEEGRRNDESPQHQVTLDRPFAVGKFPVTFDEWNACIADGGCNGYKPFDQGWGRGRRPVINVSWGDAKSYVGWLSKKPASHIACLPRPNTNT
jgi:formylglycine-generating enzyme required for sulfatase activity